MGRGLLGWVFCTVGCANAGTDPNDARPVTEDVDDVDAAPPRAGPESACDPDAHYVGFTGLRLLTRYEYDNTVRDLLGDDSQPSKDFAPENKTTAFENNARDHAPSRALARQYMHAAESIAARAVAERFETLVACDPAADDALACGRQFVAALLARAFRRPPTAEELAAFAEAFEAARDEYGFAEAITLTIQATLQSPQFLYRVELPPPEAEPGDIVAVTGYAMASRLSYFVTASMPDPALLDAAAAGELDDPVGIEHHTRRLLETPAARDTVRQFHRQWLRLSALDSVSKDAATYPGFGAPTLGAELSQSVQRFAEFVFFDDDATIETLLTSLAWLPTPALETLYGELEGQRAGLLTQPGMMALLAYPDGSSPVARGVWVRERLLCQALPPPPDNVVIDPPNPDPNATTRERFAEHMESPACSGCHALTDPIGFGFEHYDGVGRWRDEENGSPIDARGELLGLADQAQAGPFDGARALAQRLAASSDVSDCVAHQWTTFALGREPGQDDACAIETIQRAVEETDGDLHELIVAIAVSDAFGYQRVDAGAP